MPATPCTSFWALFPKYYHDSHSLGSPSTHRQIPLKMQVDSFWVTTENTVGYLGPLSQRREGLKWCTASNVRRAAELSGNKAQNHENKTSPENQQSRRPFFTLPRLFWRHPRRSSWEAARRASALRPYPLKPLGFRGPALEQRRSQPQQASTYACKQGLALSVKMPALLPESRWSVPDHPAPSASSDVFSGDMSVCQRIVFALSGARRYKLQAASCSLKTMQRACHKRLW